MEQAMKDLEKTLDLDSFGQVSFKLPQQSGVGTSSAGSSQHPTQKTSISVTGTSKGKEVDTTEHPIMTDQPATSKEQVQGKIPPIQTKEPEIPALQTPLNEEKGRNRDREEATPVSGLVEQPGAKRQRINPLPEEEIIEETLESLRGERETSPQISPVI